MIVKFLRQITTNQWIQEQEIAIQHRQGVNYFISSILVYDNLFYVSITMKTVSAIFKYDMTGSFLEEVTIFVNTEGIRGISHILFAVDLTGKMLTFD